jgi:hypothetical protein
VAQFLTSVAQFLTPVVHIQASKFGYTFPLNIAKKLILTGCYSTCRDLQPLVALFPIPAMTSRVHARSKSYYDKILEVSMVELVNTLQRPKTNRATLDTVAVDRSLRFGDNFVLDLLRMVLDDLQQFNGKLLHLTRCCRPVRPPAAPRCRLETNLPPNNIYEFVEAVANGYRIRCIPILQHFRHELEGLASDSLMTLPPGNRNRNDLITILKALLDKQGQRAFN